MVLIQPRHSRFLARRNNPAGHFFLPHPLITWYKATMHADRSIVKMAPDSSRRGFYFSGLLLPALLITSAGCNIALEAETVVTPDGSLTRTTRYIADEDSDKKELETQYALHSGGTWEVRKATKHNLYTRKDYEGTISIYQVVKRYKSGEPISSDYVRSGKSPERVSRNDISLKVHNHIFAKTFDYEEQFRDVVTKESFEAAARKLYAASIEYFADQLARELEDGVTLGQAREALKKAFDPLLRQFMDGIRHDGRAFFESKKFKEDLEPALEIDQLVARVIQVLPPPSPEQTNSWQQAVHRACEKSGETSQSLEGTGLEEELFGVYGFTLFQTYTFRETLSLPGKLLESNATKREGSVLSWEFSPSDFQWQDYVLRARSRIIHKGRIMFAGIAVLLLAVTVFRRRRVG